MGRKKQTNDVLAGNNNGGLHSARGLATLQQVLTTHDLKEAVMYQFILSGSTKAEYQATMKAIIRHIRTKCRAEYIGGYEVGEEKNGIHAHAFVIIETFHHFPADLLDVTEGNFIARRIKRKAKAKANEADKSLSIRIEPPKNRMHRRAMFARMNTPAKLADCIKWASYYLKARSKDDVPGRETYFGSEFASNIAKREAQRQKYRDALTKTKPAAILAPTIKENTMTPADQYVAGRYEAAVDQQLDLDALRLYLLSKGIKRTPAQVVDDLDNVYGFHGYTASHPAPPKLDLATIDKMVGRISSKGVSSEPLVKRIGLPVQKILYRTSEPVHNTHTIF